MEEDRFRDLRKRVRRTKRIATERAAQLHDLVEERLPQAYEEIPSLAQACYESCVDWARASAALAEAESAAEANTHS